MATQKLRWADMTDDDWDPPPIAVPVSVTKHGVKVKKRAPSPPPAKPTYVPPHLRNQDKNQTPSKGKDGNL